MAKKNFTRCKSASCWSTFRGELFPAKTTNCPYCQSAVELVTVTVAGGSNGKGGGKAGGGKSFSTPNTSGISTASKKSRKKVAKKQPSKIKFTTGTPLSDRKLGQHKAEHKKTTARKIYRGK